MSRPSPRTRFAPSPTGYLHLGHAFSAKLARDWADRQNGECWLRIEDIDLTRRRDHFVHAISEDLDWLGIAFDGPLRLQSDHFAQYAERLDQLIAADLVYRCFRTRRELAGLLDAPQEGAIAPVFFGTRLGQDEEQALLAQGQAFAWRLDARRLSDLLSNQALSFEEMGEGAAQQGHIRVDPLRLGDAVLARKDTPVSYHLAVVHDDALQAMTHIIRGADLADSTHLHVALQAALDLPTPIYAHHRLIRDENGSRLAKRDGAPAIRDLRAQGLSPAQVWDLLGR